MSDKNKISIFVYVSILINLIVLALFITFVFGLKKDAFDVDTKKLDRNALICQNSIVNLVKDYDERLNKIVESYPFINLLQQVILNGIDTAERDRIISIFRSGNYPFDTVALYLADGKSVFSSPVKTKPVDLESYKNSKAIAFFDKDYDGVYFVKPIKNDRGIEVGYIVASVFKKIFENTPYNLNFVVLSNGVVYYNPSIDINSISIDSLTQYMNKDIGSTGSIEADNNTFAFYSGKVKDIDNFSTGILELNVPIVQKYLKYIILGLLSLSFIFLLTTALVERFKPAAANNNIVNDEPEDDDIYDESEPPENNYANSNIVNDEEFNIDDYDNDIEGLDDESIKYLNKVDKITKNSKIDLPNLDEVEDIKVEDHDDNLNNIIDYEDDDEIKLDDVLEDGGEKLQDEDENIKLDDLSSLDKVLENEEQDDDESIKLENIENLDDVLDEQNDELDDIPSLDEVLDEDNEEKDDEDVPNLDDVLDEQNDKLDDIPSLDEVLDEDNEEKDDEDVPNLDDVLDEQNDELDDIPSLDEVLDENNEDNENKDDEDVPNLDDVLDEQNDELDDIPSLDELLDEDNEEKDDEDVPNLDDVLDEQNDELDDIPSLDEVLDENNDELNDNTENTNDENIQEMREYSDEELLDPNNILDDEEENNIDDTVGNLDDIPNLNDEIKDTEEDNEDNKNMLEMGEYSDEELLDSDNILDDEEENNIDNTVGNLDDIPDLDDEIKESEEQENQEQNNNDENIPEMKEYSDEELLDSSNILDDEEENNIDDTVGDLDDIPDLDDEIKESEEQENQEQNNNDENVPEMKEYSDEELLDSDNILDDEEENNIDDTVEDLDDIPNLHDEIKESEEQENQEQNNNDENVPEMKEYSDEELLDSDNILDDEEENNIDDTVEDLDDIPDLHDEIKESEENDNEELEEAIDDNDNSSDNDIIKGIDDIIEDNDENYDNNEGDILISHGSILEDEIVKKEEEYFSSSDAFNFSLNRDFLLGDYDDEESDNNDTGTSNISPNFSEEYDDGEVIKPASEKDTFDTEDLIDKDLYDPEEVPKVPDDFYREAEEKVKENMTSNWKKVLKAIRGKKFVNKNMSDMLEWVKDQSGLDIVHAAMLSRQDNGNYDIVESQNISDSTKDKLSISENEALFKKILSHKKTLYVSDPFASDSIKSKFDPEDRKDISHMIFVPIENDEGGLKSFFIGLSSN